MRVLWPGWCGLPFCPEPLPARLLAAEPRVLARLDPLAAEALEPGSSRAVAAAARAARGPGVAAGRWSLSLRRSTGYARLLAVDHVKPSVYVVLRLGEAARLGAARSAARRLQRLAGVESGEAQRLVEEALRRLRLLNSSVDHWVVETPEPGAGLGEASEAYARLAERLANPPLGLAERPLRLVIHGAGEQPGGEWSREALEELLDEARRAGLVVARSRGRPGGRPRLRGLVARSGKPRVIRLLVEAAEQGWAPFTHAYIDWGPRDPAVVELVLPPCRGCVREARSLLGGGLLSLVWSPPGPEAAMA